MMVLSLVPLGLMRCSRYVKATHHCGVLWSTNCDSQWNHVYVNGVHGVATCCDARPEVCRSVQIVLLCTVGCSVLMMTSSLVAVFLTAGLP
jgi:hypothetical protein